MGAMTFHVSVPRNQRIDTPLKAFNVAVEQALYDEGHSGYSGTIAEKHTFDVIKPNTDESVAECIDRATDDQFEDKWGPAGCIVTGDSYIFFGWASS